MEKATTKAPPGNAGPPDKRKREGKAQVLREVEKALRMSEEKYESVVENIGIGVVLISPGMEILALNRKMREWFPWIDPSEKPLCYRSFNDPPRDSVCAYCPTYRTLQDGGVHEAVTDTPMKGGTIRNYRIVSSPVTRETGEIEAAIEMVEDITENRELRERLSQSEKLYQTIFETTGTGMVIVEEDMTISLVNREFERLSGYRSEELTGKSLSILISPSDLGRMTEYHRERRIDPGAAPASYDFTLIDREGREKDIFITVSMIPGTVKSVASFLDISETRRLHRKLSERSRKYRLLADNVSDVIWTMDMNLRFTYVSPSVEQLRGYRPWEAMRQSLREMLTPPSFDLAMEVFREELAMERDPESRRDRTRVLELEMIRKDGSTVWVEIKLSFLRDEEGGATGIVGVSRDISDRIRAGREIERAGRELEAKSLYLEETNTALRVLLRNMEEEKLKVQGNVLSSARELLLPLVEKLRGNRPENERNSLLDALETNIAGIISPFARNLTLREFHLTPTELRIADLIRQGRSTKEAAELMNLSIRSVEFHRDNLREKLGLKGKKINLQSFLTSLS
jgi:PAS domain S-box-containing protein